MMKQTRSVLLALVVGVVLGASLSNASADKVQFDAKGRPVETWGDLRAAVSDMDNWSVSMPGIGAPAHAVYIDGQLQGANCNYTGGPINLCQLATLTQGMLDLGYADSVPVARVVAGAPERPGVVIGQTVTWLKPESAVMVARGVWRRVPDGSPRAQPVVFIK